MTIPYSEIFSTLMDVHIDETCVEGKLTMSRLEIG